MAKKPTARTQQRAKFESATVTVADIASGKWRTTDLPSLVKRFVGTSAFCAAYNARNLAACHFALYRPKRGRSSGRGLTRREADWLRRTDPHGPGTKAAARMGTDDTEAVEEHPLLDLLRDPNPRDTGYEFWEAHHCAKEITGNAFVLVVEEGGKPRLEALQPQYVRIIPSRDGIVDGYVYGRARDVEVTFTAGEVLHERFAKSMFDPYYGAGPLQQAVVPHDIRVAMNEWSLAVFDKMARPDYAVIFKSALTDKQRQQAREEIRRRHQGQAKIGEVMILSGGEADVKPLGWSPKELDYDQGRKTVDTEICTAFGVPETFLRPNEGALSQAREMRRWYGLTTLLPRAVKHAEWLTERVVPLFEDTEGYWFAAENPVPEDEALQATRVSTLVVSGVMTINEARRDVGLDSSDDDGADVLRVNGVPLDRVGAPVFGGFNNDGGGGPQDGTPVDIDNDKWDDVVLPGDDGADTKKTVLQSEAWAAKEQASPLYRAPVDPMEEASRRFFRAQMKATLAEMDAKPSGYQKHGRMAVAHKATPEAEAEARRLLGVWGVTDDKWVRYLADRLQPLAEERMLDSAVRAIRYVQGFADVLDDAKPANIPLQNPRAASWAARNTGDLLRGCEGVNATTADRLAATLAEGIMDGESIPEMKKRVKAAYEEEMPGGESMSDYRANMIARTETARAAVNGQLAGWDASGVVEGKRWLLSPDGCEFCEAAAKQYAETDTPLGQSLYGLGSELAGTDGGTMRFDFSPVDGPPLHPHCKCSLIPVIKGYGPAVKP